MGDQRERTSGISARRTQATAPSRTPRITGVYQKPSDRTNSCAPVAPTMSATRHAAASPARRGTSRPIPPAISQPDHDAQPRARAEVLEDLDRVGLPEELRRPGPDDEDQPEQDLQRPQ